MSRSCVTLNCAECNKPFSKELRAYNSALKSGRDTFWCSSSCMKDFKTKVRTESVVCVKCGSIYDRTANIKKKKMFCSQKCANSKIHSDETKQKISESLLKRIEDCDKKKNLLRNYKCSVCDNEFTKIGYIGPKYCSSECRKIMMKSYNTLGGYREGSGRSISGYYKGIFCGSTYELVYVIYNLDHNVEFKRFEGCITDGTLKYFPDFYIEHENRIIEIKGYENSEHVKRKCQLAVDKGYSIDVLYRDNLEYAFEYVQKVYNTDKYFTLYDNFRPRFCYSCDFCGKQFSRDVRARTNRKFCSLSCSGKYPNKREK